jgi:hypothetical protein
MTRLFNILNGGIKGGKQIQAGEALWPGELVLLATSGSTVTLGSASDVIGFAYGDRSFAYRPTTREFAIGDVVAVVWGQGEALVSADYFTSGSVPSADDVLYAADDGLMDTTGSVVVGRCQSVVTQIVNTGGVGEQQSVAHIRFDIGA